MPFSFFPQISSIINWGNIHGDISKQTDLTALLEQKASSEHQHNYIEHSTIVVPFTKYGNLTSSDYIHSYIAAIPEARKAKITALTCLCSSGKVEFSIICDGIIIAEFDHIEAEQSKKTIRPIVPIPINNDSVLQLIIDSIEDNPKDLAVYLFIELWKNDEY